VIEFAADFAVDRLFRFFSFLSRDVRKSNVSDFFLFLKFVRFISESVSSRHFTTNSNPFSNFLSHRPARPKYETSVSTTFRVSETKTENTRFQSTWVGLRFGERDLKSKCVPRIPWSRKRGRRPFRSVQAVLPSPNGVLTRVVSHNYVMPQHRRRSYFSGVVKPVVLRVVFETAVLPVYHQRPRVGGTRRVSRKTVIIIITVCRVLFSRLQKMATDGFDNQGMLGSEANVNDESVNGNIWWVTYKFMYPHDRLCDCDRRQSFVSENDSVRSVTLITSRSARLLRSCFENDIIFLYPNYLFWRTRGGFSDLSLFRNWKSINVRRSNIIIIRTSLQLAY